MEILKSIASVFAGTMDIPPSFGLLHFASILVFIIATVLVCKFFKNSSDKVMRRIMLISWIVMLVLEIIKQLVFTYSRNWVYQWDLFPFQLCSSPIYALPFIAFMKDSKFRDAMMAFISTFAFFGGLVVFVYPNDVFCKFTFINIQTMIHHGLQLLLGTYLFVYNRKKISLKYFLPAIVVFAVFCTVAIILNEILYSIIVTNSWNCTFNMFYFSPHYKNHLPILSTISELVHPVIFIVIYILGFTGISLGIQYAMQGITKLVSKFSKKNA